MRCVGCLSIPKWHQTLPGRALSHQMGSKSPSFLHPPVWMPTHRALIDLLECFEHFLGHLKTFTVIPSTLGGIFLAKIMAELLSVLALAMQQINQGRFSEFV